MKKVINKIAVMTLAGALVVSSQSISVTAASLSSALPVAGIARALNEGKSVTVVKADKIRSDEAQGTALISVGASSEIDDEYTLDTDVSSIKDTTGINDSVLLTVGAASATVTDTSDSDDKKLDDKKSGDKKSKKSDKDEKDSSKAVENEDESVSDNSSDIVEEVLLEDDSDTDIDESQEGEYETSDAELFSIESDKKNVQEEDFTNLVIAQVNDYVNVRSEPSEEGEIVGKLYNNSAGDLIEEAGDWYKIKSGNCTGYVKGEYVVTGEAAQSLAKEVGTRMASVVTTTLYVRQEPSTDAAVIGMVPMDDELTVSDELDGWAKVSVEEGDGYVSTEFVKLYTEFVHAESKEEEEARLAKEEAARKAAIEAARKAQEKADKEKEQKKQKEEDSKKKKNGSNNSSAPAVTYQASGSGTGSAVANYALKFVGNPYVYGGTSLTNGADCSGFVMSVYRNFGVSLPHSSGADRSVGYAVSGGLANAQPGDLICYSGHVGIYIGNGQLVHASTAKTGIKVSNAGYRSILAIRRIF